MNSSSRRNVYSVFGLRVHSDLALPELRDSSASGLPDITIKAGAVPDRGGHFELSPVEGALILTVPEVARFMISDGRTIVVEPFPGVPDRNVRIFLLGSAFGALLHQRGMLPLHANAVEIESAAVAFMGASGQGKSTLAAWFNAQGDRVIADDVCVVGFDADRRPYASPGLPRLRLWAEALQLMGHDTADFDRSYIGEAGIADKFDVPIKTLASSRGNVPLAALYLLERGREFAISSLTGVEAAEAVIANTYRGSYLIAVKGQQDHWRASIELVRRIPVFRATRRWNLTELDDQSRRLRDHAITMAAQDHARN